MKLLITNFLAFVILANSVSWFMDGDFEAVINDHEIHEVNSVNDHLTAANIVDDHHCEVSSHFPTAILESFDYPFSQGKAHLSYEPGNNYLSALLAQLKRPPISIS